MDNSTLYTEQEQLDLELIRQRRLEIVDAMFKDGAPTNDKKVLAINNVLTSMENNINNKVTNRLKLEETASKDALLDIVAETLKTINSNGININVNRETKLADNHIPVDMVEGETDINPERLNLEDYISKDSKND